MRHWFPLNEVCAWVGAGFCALFTMIAAAQDIMSLAQQNYAYGQNFDAMMAARQQQIQMQQMQTIQAYIQYYGLPRLQAEYQEQIRVTGVPLSFDQFVYYHMWTAGGQNAAWAMQQQDANFHNLQQAHQTQQQGFDIQNQAWQQNQQILGNAIGQYSPQAIMGNQIYLNPQTGQQFELPQVTQPGLYQHNGGYYLVTPDGSYYQMDTYGNAQPLSVAPSGSGGQ